MDPHRKHLPRKDVFIARRLDAKHLHGSEATDKLGLLPLPRARRTSESPTKTVLKLHPSTLGDTAQCFRRSRTVFIEYIAKDVTFGYKYVIYIYIYI